MRELMSGRKPPDADRASAIIDENLKKIYADLVQDDLPDRFKDLLAVLKAQDEEQKDKK